MTTTPDDRAAIKAIVFGATGAQLAVGGAALAAGAVLFLTTRWVHRRTEKKPA